MIEIANQLPLRSGKAQRTSYPSQSSRVDCYSLDCNEDRLMFSRCCRISLPILLSLVCSPLLKAGDGEASTLRRVRMIYLVSHDREENARYTAAIEHAIRDLQNWYGQQLKGPTFRLSDPVVEVVKSNRPADWFYGNPNAVHTSSRIQTASGSPIFLPSLVLVWGHSQSEVMHCQLKRSGWSITGSIIWRQPTTALVMLDTGT